ncbi:oligosaccharide flippase family protein [Pontibacter sp. G13]|uniref:oligosaccharide flippase family protein n=1 Tax=Pontibacter sp. G13 TaxID=3074898 RepID=UPI00288A27E5|nr:oligosaccharide flippase family protein [Pontibacter sp. G13]WNJ16127.1 oligosaccharide flippase family protein [Pontibacter sp. G13]
MGIVRRQSIINLGVNGFGAALGLFNKIFLMVWWLDFSQIGLIELLISYMVLGAQFSQIGAPRIVIRFLPYFDLDDDRRRAFYNFVFLIFVVGIGLAFLLFNLIMPWVVEKGMSKSPLFSEHYLYIFPLLVAFAGYNCLSAFYNVKLNSVLPVFLHQVVWRLSITVLLVLHYLEVLTFDQFLIGFVASHFIMPVVLLWKLEGRVKGIWDGKFPVLKGRIRKILLNFGSYSALSGISHLLLTKMDIIMVGWLLGESEAAPYGIGFALAIYVGLIGKSSLGISLGLVSTHMKNKAYDKVDQLYKKHSLNNLLGSFLLLILLWAGIESLVEYEPDKYGPAKWVGIWLGVSALINTSVYLCRPILSNSTQFRLDLILGFLMIFVGIFFNLWLIPIYGVTGAAIATCCVFIIVNIVGMIILWAKFKIQPFTVATLKTVILGLAVLGLSLIVPRLEQPFVDLIVRSFCVLVVYGGLVYALGISPDLNQLIKSQYQKVSRTLLSKK